MISILIPIYNGIEFIEESVSSVLSQTYSEWELLIGINGHPQNSDVYKIAKEYEKKSNKIKVFDFYTRKGKSNTLNEMIQHCSYNYVAILDVDDIWHVQKLEIQIEKVLEGYDVIGSKCVCFGNRVNKQYKIPNLPIGDISNYNFSLTNPIINSSAIIKKELCHWNENGIEDYDLWLKLKKYKKKFYNYKQILVKHRLHHESAFNAKGNGSKVDNLLISHGYKSRKEIEQNPSKINIPFVNKMKMVIK
jgi:glycosyltransferase involved in cell wall biosynthesis